MNLEEAYGEHDEMNQDVLPAGLLGQTWNGNLLDNNIYGDELAIHREELSLLSGLLNINGLHKKGDKNNKTLFNHLCRNNFDIMSY